MVSTRQAVRATRAERVQRQLRRAAEIAEKKARTEASKSRLVAQFLEDMLQGVGPSVALGRDTTALLEILEKTDKRIGTELGDEPEVEAELRNTIGEVYLALGQYGRAEKILRQALAKSKLLGRVHREVATSLGNLALALENQDKLTEAESMQREALAIRRELFGYDHLEVASSLNSLAIVLRDEGNLQEAQRIQREALTIQEKLLGKEHPDVATSLNNFADMLRIQGELGASLLGQQKYAEAEPLLLAGYEGMKLGQREMPADGLQRLSETIHRIVQLYELTGRADQAGEWRIREGFARTEAEAARQGETLRSEALDHARQGHWKDAAADLAKALALNPGEHLNWYQLAPLLVQLGDTVGYRRHCQAMLDRFSATRDSSIAERSGKASLLFPLGEAELAVAGRLVEMSLSVSRDDPWKQIAAALKDYRQGRYGRAAEWAQRTLANPGEDFQRDIQAYMVLAMARYRLHQADEARLALAEGEETLETKLPKVGTGDIGRAFHDWLAAHILLREAKTLIEGQTAPPTINQSGRE